MKIFISHSTEDSEAADRLSSLLQTRKMDAWTSARLRPGADWKAAIRQAISEANGFLFLISSHSNEDRWQQIEWQSALESDWDREAGRPMVPILIGEVAVPTFLADRLTLRGEGSLDLLIDQIVPLLLNPDTTRLPINYEQAREEQKQRLDLVKRFALSLKSANHLAEGRSLPR